MVGDDHDCSSCYTKTSTADPIGLCGKYTVNFNGSDTEGDVAKVDYDTYITVKYAGLTALVNELDATAQDFVIYNADRKVPGCDSKSVVGCFPQDRLNSSASSVVSGAGVYQAAIEPARIICSNAAATQHCDFNVSLLEEIPAVLQPDGTYACKAGYSLVEKMCKRESGDPSSKRKFIDDIKTQGWLSAGSYYFDVAQLNENQIKWDNTNYKISFAMNGQPPFVSDSGGTTEGSFSQVTKYMKDNLAFSSIDPDFTKEIDMKVFPGGNSMITDFKNRLWVVTGLAGSYSPTTKPEFLGVEPQAYKFMNDITETLRSSTKSGDVKAPFIFSDASITPNLSTSLVGVPNDVICGLVPVGTLICALGLNKSGDSLVFGPMMTSLSAIYYSWGKNLRASTDFPLIRLHNFGSDVLKSVVECFDGIFSGIRSWLKVFFWKEIAMNIIGIVLVGLQIHGSFWGVGPSWRLDAIVQYMNNIYNALFSVIFLLPLLMTLPMALSVMMPLFMIGITLAYYIPLIPFMLFTFGTITWLIFVVEAMAAAPLIALGLTHPEGHDLLGKAEQALLLLFSVFLRPAGMVIGLIASLILSYVALNVLNYGFDQVMVKIGGMMNFGGHAILVAYFKSVIGVVLLMIYVLIVMALMNQCFAMIHLIPEKFSRWIGGHPEVGADVQMLESVKGGIAPFAEAGRAAGETTGKLAGGVGEFMPTKTRYTDVKPESKEEGPAFRPK